MAVLHDLLVMFFHDGADSAPHIKAQKGKELVVEAHGNAHVAGRDLDVVDDRFHGISLASAGARDGPGIVPRGTKGDGKVTNVGYWT